jgi:competence CoiA-like predicted nuclease
MVKHFRHKVACECDTEPETPAHVWGKETVYDTLKVGFEGYIEVEDLIGRLKSDVHWVVDGKKVAFEIQATNYEPAVFDEKIAYYTGREYLTVYLFVGDNFGRTV